MITSFIIEWKNLNKEEEMKWVRVPANISKYYVYGECALENVRHCVNCYGTEKSSITELLESFPPLCDGIAGKDQWSNS